MKIYVVLGGEKTKPIQSQYYLAPRFIWGLKTQFEKTNPICRRAKWRNTSNNNGLWRF